MRHGPWWICLTPWVFACADDAWVSASTGEAIPEDVSLNSPLVRVGPDHGFLVTPQGPTVVRADVLPKQPALRAAMQVAEALRAPRAPSAPCPSGPAESLPGSCQGWCGQVLPGSTARSKGSCSDGLQCWCEADGRVYASCRMTCEAERMKAAAPAAKMSTSTTTTQATALTKGSSSSVRRQLLYDTRVFVDFLTQVEVFFVAIELVRRLNQLVKENYGAATGELRCRPWSLVLPPWCFVPMWYGEAGNVKRWNSLFDMAKLSGEVQVEEFAQQQVDLGVLPVASDSRLPKLKEGSGDFLGFTKDMQVCNGNGQQAPEAGSTRGSVVYAGYCASDITVSSLKCGVLNFGFKAVVDLLDSAGKRSSSILLKHLDALQLHKLGDVGILSLPALAVSPALQQSAQRFRESPVALGSLPYLAVYLNTHDVAQKDLAPSAAAAAARINRVLKKKKLEQVFVAGVLREGFQRELRLLVKEALYFSQDDGADRLHHRGAEELVELLLCSKAEYFIGSSNAVFSAAVRRQRQHAGLANKSSEEVFCDSLQVSDASKRCTA